MSYKDAARISKYIEAVQNVEHKAKIFKELHGFEAAYKEVQTAESLRNLLNEYLQLVYPTG